MQIHGIGKFKIKKNFVSEEKHCKYDSTIEITSKAYYLTLLTTK